MNSGFRIAAALACAGILHVSAAQAAAEKVLYSFCTTFPSCDGGSVPEAGLLNLNGKLYGTTEAGGSGCATCGTVFSFDPESGSEAVLYSFQADNDGINPVASVIDVQGTLYGTTKSGGANDEGTVFSFNLKTGKEKVLHSFGGSRDGANPVAGLVDVTGTLYGTTEFGGANNVGTLFAFDLKTGKEKLLYSFGSSGNDADLPYAGLIRVGGKLYGTTVFGGGGSGPGCENCGAVYAFDLATGTERVLHGFTGSDGGSPMAGLIYVRGDLYGTAFGGGAAGWGAVFSISLGGTEKVIHSFKGGSDGAEPQAGLVSVEGKLYGTTNVGGTGNCTEGATTGCGTVFAVDPANDKEAVLHSFANGSDGENPVAGLVALNGILYGTTSDNGAVGIGGTLYSIKP